MEKTRNKKIAKRFNKPRAGKCTVSAVVDKDLALALKEIAQEKRCPVSNLVECALGKYLEKTTTTL